ncbi:MAG: Tn3 family transposase [Steroidobacteraceae bacterium]
MPRGRPEVPGLEPVVRRDLDFGLIHSEFHDLMRVAGSINDGYGSATFLLERLGSAARGSRLYRAGTQLCQVWGAVYLADDAAQPEFRRSVNRLLVRGESVHQLERVIDLRRAHIARQRRHRLQHVEASSGTRAATGQRYRYRPTKTWPT